MSRLSALIAAGFPSQSMIQQIEPLTMEQLKKGFEGTWYFVGNDSLFKFDGKVRRSTHALEASDRKLVQMIAGA